MMMNNETTPAGANPVKLSLNYHFGHPESSVFFLPINQMLLINHASNRTKAGLHPNAEIRWSTDSKSSYYLQRPLEDLEKVKYLRPVAVWFALSVPNCADK
jgi:hypothetical protein